jgi:hypothetical protein
LAEREQLIRVWWVGMHFTPLPVQYPCHDETCQINNQLEAVSEFRPWLHYLLTDSLPIFPPSIARLYANKNLV